MWNKIKHFVLGICVGIIFSFGTMVFITDTKSEVEEPLPIKLEQPYFFLEEIPNDSLVHEACLYYGLHEPEIVMVQAVLETGHFRSDNCLIHNNLFGLYNSHRKEYFKFDHWTESVKAYRDMIQYRLKENEDYYTFLKRIGYAEDPKYITKVKNIRKRYNL